jgi:hypothetical protein
MPALPSDLRPCDQTIFVRTLPTPEIMPSSRSPRTMAATPAGVPFMIRSPAPSLSCRGRQATVSGMLEVIFDRSEDWRSLPFIFSSIRPEAGCPIVAAGKISPIGAEWSKPLDMSHGRPAFLAEACKSRLVMSGPAA